MANIKPLYFDVATGGFKGLSGSDAIDFGGILLSKSGSDLQWDGVSLATTNDVVTGLKIKGSVVAMADSNIDLSVATDGSTIDGASISNGDRVLLTGQSSAAENGIYVATTATAANSWSPGVHKEHWLKAEIDVYFKAIAKAQKLYDLAIVSSRQTCQVLLSSEDLNFLKLKEK